MSCLISSSFSVDTSAPDSAARSRSAISRLSASTLAAVRASFSLVASTSFHACSISCFRPLMVAWSSSDRRSAVCTFVAFSTTSAFRSRHFRVNERSDASDDANAAWSFSYSPRNVTSDASPAISARVCEEPGEGTSARSEASGGRRAAARISARARRGELRAQTVRRSPRESGGKDAAFGSGNERDARVCSRRSAGGWGRDAHLLIIPLDLIRVDPRIVVHDLGREVHLRARAPNLARRRVQGESRSLSRGGSIRRGTLMSGRFSFVNARNRRLRTHHGTRSRGCVTEDHDTRPSRGCHAAVHLQSARSPRPASVRLDLRRVAKRLAGGRRIDLARVAQSRVRRTRETPTPARARARPGARPRRVRAQS